MDDEPDELPSLFALAAARLRTLKHVPKTMNEAVQEARPKLGKGLLPDPRGSKRKHADRAEAEAARSALRLCVLCTRTSRGRFTRGGRAPLLALASSEL